MKSATQRLGPVRRKKRPAKYPSRVLERVEGDKDFWEGWGFSHDTSRGNPHYFTPSVQGMRISLCRNVLQAPVWIVPTDAREERVCKQCWKLLKRREDLALQKKERELRRNVDGRVARFLADPSLGPRLYGCPVCQSVYEGMAPNLFPCSDGGHPATMVVELARKDTWTRDDT